MNITIIGGGLSGILLTINLLRQASEADKLSITLVDRNPDDQIGPAYSTNEDCLLLNVPACRMGAFSTDPGHFLSWARAKGEVAGELDFLPRKLYKEYLLELLKNALSENETVAFTRIFGEATDIKVRAEGAEVFVGQKSFISDKVVLALGNFPPRNLSVKNHSFYKSNRYFQNPWYDGVFSFLMPDDKVILIGTGQTMIDIAARLSARKHKGKIIAVSRHGYLPLAHSTFETYPSFYDEIIKLTSMTDILRAVRKHFVEAEKLRLDKNGVIDSMRPYTQELWMKLSVHEKSRFLRHLFRHFEIVRSRIPDQSLSVVNQMRLSGQLTIIRGRICDMVEKENYVEVWYLPVGEAKEKIKTAELVINCSGPELDYTKLEQHLIKNLLGKGLIQPGNSHLGIEALPNGAIISSDNKAHNILYTLGSTMRGVLWEVIAVPEIRLQATQLAQLLLKN